MVAGQRRRPPDGGGQHGETTPSTVHPPPIKSKHLGVLKTRLTGRGKVAAKSWIIVVEQKVLEPWEGQIDLVDAALINHVIVRLTRRERQRVVLHEGTACVWVHYPTVRAENWLIDLSPAALKKRLAKLVGLGLLVRTQLSVKNSGTCRGSRSYYGIGPVLKARYTAVDSAEVPAKNPVKPVDNLTTEGDHGTPHSYEGDHGTPDYEGDHGRPQSLGESPGRRVAAGAGRTHLPLAAGRPPGPEGAGASEPAADGQEGKSKEGLGELRQRMAEIPDLLDRCRAKAHYRELGFDV